MRKANSKTSNRRLWLFITAAAVMVIALSVASVAAFSANDSPETASAVSLGSWGNLQNGTNYELAGPIDVGASAMTNSVSNVTVDGKGNTITIKGSGDLYNVENTGGGEASVGLLFGEVSGLTLKNVKIVYEASVSIRAYNKASRPGKKSTNAAGPSSIIYCGIIAGLMKGSNTLDNVSIEIGSSAKFAALGVDSGNNDKENCGPGQGAAAGSIAGSLQGTVNITGLSFTNNGLIHARAESIGANQVYKIKDGLFITNDVEPDLTADNRVTASAGGLFGVIGSYGSTTGKGNAIINKLEILGSGAVGAYINDTNITFDYAGGLVGNVKNDGSNMNLQNVYYRANIQVYARSGNGQANLLLGTGSDKVSLNGIWINFGNSTVKSSRYNASYGGNSANNIGGISKPSNVGGEALEGTGGLGISNPSGVRQYDNNVSYQGTKTLSGYSKDITGFARSSAAGEYNKMTDYMNLYVKLGSTSNVILSYINNASVFNEGNRRDYYQSKHNDNKELNVTDIIKVTNSATNNYADIVVMIADTYNVGYDSMIISGNEEDLTYSGTNPGIRHTLTIDAADSNILSWLSDYRWYSEHYFINAYGAPAGNLNYTYTDDDGIEHDASGDGNLNYDTFSPNGANTISTDLYAGIYRIKLVRSDSGDTSPVAAKAGELVAMTNNYSSFYYFEKAEEGEKDYLEYKILRRPLRLSAIESAQPITKEYDGTTEVYSENIIAGSHYNAMMIDDDGNEVDIYTGDNDRMGLKILEGGGFTSSEVGETQISLQFTIDNTSDYVQIDDAGNPTSETLTLSNITGEILRRGLKIVYGDEVGSSDVIYNGLPVHPDIRGFYVDNETINNNLSEEIAKLFDPDNFIVETFSDMISMNAYNDECRATYGTSQTELPENTFEPAVKIGIYYVLVVLKPQAYNECNFQLSNSEGGRYSIFNIVPRQVELDWEAMKEQLTKTYSGQNNTFTVVPVWKSVDSVAESGVADIDVTFADENGINPLGYKVTYSAGSVVYPLGVVNAGTYDVSIILSSAGDALGRPSVVENYTLIGETAGQIVIEKADIAVEYSIRGFNGSGLLDGTGTTLTYNQLYGQFSNITGRNDLDISKLIAVTLGSSPDEINTSDAGTSGERLVSLNRSYSYEGGNYSTLWNVGSYTVTVTWASSYANAIYGGYNYNIVNSTHTFVISPLAIEYGEIQVLSFTYSATSNIPVMPSSNTNYYDGILFTEEYYYYDDSQPDNLGAKINDKKSIIDAGKYVLKYYMNAGGSGSNAANYIDNPALYVFEITPYDIGVNAEGSFSISVHNRDKQYMGQGESVELQYINDYVVSFDGSRLNMNEDFSVSYENNVNISSTENPAKILISGIDGSNFTGTAEATFNIWKRSLSMQIYYIDDSGMEVAVDNRAVVDHTYDGTDVFASNRFRVELYYLTEDENGNEIRVVLPETEVIPYIEYKSVSAINVGEYELNAGYTEPSGNENYSAESIPECTLDISPRLLTLTVSAPDDQAEGEAYSVTDTADGGKNFAVVYNGTDRTLKVSIGNLVNGESITASISFRDYQNGYYNDNVKSDETANVGTYLLRIDELIVAADGRTDLNNYDSKEIDSANRGTIYQLTVNKRDVYLTLSPKDDTIEIDEEAVMFTAEYDAKSKAGLISWKETVSRPGEGLIEKDREDFEISLSFFNMDTDMSADPINAGTYEIRNSNFANNPNYNVRIAEAGESGETAIVWRLRIRTATLEVTPKLTTYSRLGSTYDGKIYDGLPFSIDFGRIDYVYSGFKGNDGSNESLFDAAFTYEFFVIDGENRVSLGNIAPSDTGTYCVKMIWQPSSYPVKNYSLSEPNGYLEREFTIAKRYLGVTFSGSEQQTYNAAYQARNISLITLNSSLPDSENSGTVGTDKFEFINMALEISADGLVFIPLNEDFPGYKNVGTYFFTGYLNPDADPEIYANANYEIYYGSFEYAANSDWEAEGYPDLGDGLYYEGNRLIAPGKLQITQFILTFNVENVADQVTLAKEYGIADGDNLNFAYELIPGELLDMRLLREEGENVSDRGYTVVGVEIVDPAMSSNYHINGISGSLTFQINKRQVSVDINNKIIIVDYDGRKYLRSENDIPPDADPSNYVYPEIKDTNPFYMSTQVPIIGNEENILEFALRPDLTTNGVSDAGWYNISTVVLLSSENDDAANFTVTLVSTSFQKFRIAPQTIDFRLGDIDGAGFLQDENDPQRYVLTEIFSYLNFAEPDYYRYIERPEKSEDGYWGYQPLDAEYSEWLERGSGDEEALTAIFKKYFRIEREKQGEENSNFVGEYAVTVTVLNGEGGLNINFETHNERSYFLIIEKFDLNTVLTDNDWNLIVGLIGKEKVYDGTNNIGDLRTRLEALLYNDMEPASDDRFSQEFSYYYKLLNLRFTATYDSDTGYFAGDDKNITLSCNFLGSSGGSTLNSNFILPESKKLQGAGTILKKQLTVSVSDYNSVIALIYGESITFSGSVTEYSDFGVYAVFEGFIAGENAANANIVITLKYVDGQAYDRIRTVGKYTLALYASYADGAIQNYEISDAATGREQAYRTVQVSARSIYIEASGQVYEKPLNGRTDVPNFYTYNGTPQSPTSIFNDYFNVVGLLTGLEDANLRISYNVSMTTREVSDDAFVMMNRFVLYTGDESQNILNENYTMASNVAVYIPARIRSLGTVTINEASGGTMSVVYNNQPVSVSYTGELLEMEGYEVSVELRYSGAYGTGTIYPVDENDENYLNGYSFVAPENAGDYDINVVLKISGDESNPDMETYYSTQGSVRLKILKAKPTILFSAQNIEMVYGEFDSETNAVTASVYFLASEEVPSMQVPVSYSFVSTDGIIPENPPIGTHKITASFFGNENYEGVSALEANTTLKITPKKITVTISGTKDLVYSGIDLSDFVKVSFTGVIEGDDCQPIKRFTNNTSNTAVTEIIDAGQYTVRVSPSNNNYEISGPSAENFTVKKRTLTVTAVAPGTHLGDTPQFEYTYDGFAEGDTAEDLLKAPSVNLGGVMVGDNTIRPSGGDDPNYDFVYNETILVILQPVSADGEKTGEKLSNTTTILLVIGGAVVGIALLIVLAYVLKTMTYRSMYNVSSVKKKVNEEFKHRK